MAFHHASIFFTLVIFLWLILASAHASEKSRRNQPLRPTRTVKQRAFSNLDLLSARGYGKRIPEYSGSKVYDDNSRPEWYDDNKEARMLTGKRAVNMDRVNNFLMEWMDLESKMRNLDGYRRPSRDDEMLLPE